MSQQRANVCKCDITWSECSLPILPNHRNGDATASLHNCLTAWRAIFLQHPWANSSCLEAATEFHLDDFSATPTPQLLKQLPSELNGWLLLEISPSLAGGNKLAVSKSQEHLERGKCPFRTIEMGHPAHPAPAPPVLVSGFYSACLDFTTVISPVFIGFSCCRLWFKNFPPKLPQNSWKSSQRNINFGLPDA